MINIDHAGIGNGRLTVGVTGLEKNVALEAGQTAGLTDKLDRLRILSRRRSRAIQRGWGADRHRRQRRGPPTLSSAYRYRRYHQSGDSSYRGPVRARPHLATGECPIIILGERQREDDHDREDETPFACSATRAWIYGISSRIVDWIDGKGAVWRGGPGRTSGEPIWLAPWMSPIESCGPSVITAPLQA